MSLTRILSFEGQILSTLQVAGSKDVAAVAKDMIDAGSNVLLRLEGARAASGFAFALSDRMVGRVLGEPTEALKPGSVVYLPDHVDMPHTLPGKPTGKAASFWQGHLIGVLAGALLGLITGRAM